MKTITCDKCGKEVKPDDMYQVHFINKLGSHKKDEHLWLDLCEKCGVGILSAVENDLYF